MVERAGIEVGEVLEADDEGRVIVFRPDGETVDERVAVAAARLRARYGSALRMPDALVLACAGVRKARRVLTADERWPAWSRRVEFVGTTP